METIAIYWEEQVKVYGIVLSTGLVMVELKLPAESNIPWHSLLTIAEQQELPFELITSFDNSPEGSQLSLILKDENIEAFEKAISEQKESGVLKPLEQKRVEIIYLHGPHFQERFGILARATAPLSKTGTRMLTIGCAGNSMYIVVPEGQGERARATLKDTFEIPSAK